MNNMVLQNGVRERLQEMPAFLIEKRNRKLAEKEQFADIRRERMTCSLDPNQLRHTQDWTRNTVEMEKNELVGPAEKKHAAVQLFSREGLRWDVAMAVIAILAFVMAVVILVDLGSLGYSNKQIDKLNVKIENVTNDNMVLRQQLELSSTDLSVLTEAVKLNLVSSGSNVIKLHAPTDATLSLTANEITVNGENLGLITGD